MSSCIPFYSTSQSLTLESAGGGSLFGIFLGIAVVVLVVLVVIQAIMKRRKK